MKNKASPLSAAVLAGAIIGMLVNLALQPACNIASNNREVVAVVSEVSDDENLVSFVDYNGECWEAVVNDPEVFTVGDKYNLVFDDMGTQSIYDDMLVDIL